MASEAESDGSTTQEAESDEQASQEAAPDGLACSYCGEAGFGNEGARTQHENNCDENPEAGGQQQAQAPERRDRRGGDESPARRDDERTIGEQAADGLMAVFDDDVPTETRVKAAKNVGAAAGQALGRIIELQDQKQQRAEQQARSADLSESTEYPECDCGRTLGPSLFGVGTDEIECPNPECGKVYDIENETVR